MNEIDFIENENEESGIKLSCDEIAKLFQPQEGAWLLKTKVVYHPTCESMTMWSIFGMSVAVLVWAAEAERVLFYENDL